MTDNTPIDSAIFTETPGQFSIESSDLGKGKTYSLTLIAGFAAYTTNTAALQFDVDLNDPCQTAPLSFNPSLLTTYSYYEYIVNHD